MRDETPAQLNQCSGFLQEIVQMPIIRCQPFKDPTPLRLTGIRDVVKMNFHCHGPRSGDKWLVKLVMCCDTS